jgi:chromatin remodeling complex protein RSC6
MDLDNMDFQIFRTPLITDFRILSDELYEFLGLEKGAMVSISVVKSMIYGYIDLHCLRGDFIPYVRRKIWPNEKLHKIFNSTDNDNITDIEPYISHHFIYKLPPLYVSGFAVPSLLSDELHEFLQKNFLTDMYKGIKVPRKEVTCMINKYIVMNSLRDDEDRRVIRPNTELHKIFKSTENDRISYFNLQTYMKHLFVKDKDDIPLLNQLDTYCRVSNELSKFCNIPKNSVITHNIAVQIIKQNIKANTNEGSVISEDDNAITKELHKILNSTENDRISYIKILKYIKHHLIKDFYKTTILSAELYEFLNIKKGTWLSRKDVWSMISKYVEKKKLFDPDETKMCIIFGIGTVHYVIRPNNELHKIFKSTDNDNINYLNMVPLIEHHFYDAIDFECAALIIQRHWKNCISDPNYAICRRRLRYEFEEIAQ